MTRYTDEKITEQFLHHNRWALVFAVLSLGLFSLAQLGWIMHGSAPGYWACLAMSAIMVLYCIALLVAFVVLQMYKWVKNHE